MSQDLSNHTSHSLSLPDIEIPVIDGKLSLSFSLSSPLTGSADRSHIVKSDERGIEIDPLARFENQVVTKWLPKALPEDIDATMALYNTMRKAGHVSVEAYSAHRLAKLYQRGKIGWCEHILDEHKIESISFPMNPEYDLLLEKIGGPVIFIGDRFDRERICVMQGNHRTAAVLFRGQETNESLYAIRFKSSSYCQKLIHTTPSTGYLSPVIPSKYRDIFSKGGAHGGY